MSGIDWSARTWDEVRARHAWRIPRDLNIAHACCDVHAEACGDRVALITVDAIGDRHEKTFAELKDEADRTAAVFADLGVERGDRVAVYLPQTPMNPLAHLAAFKRGAISVPLSPLFRADALAYRLAHSESKLLVTDAEHQAYVDEALREWRKGAPPPRVIVDVDLAARAAHATPIEAVQTSADDPAMVIYTSGTSGLPKGALHAHRFIPGRLSGFELIHHLEGGADLERPFWTPADWAWVGGLVDCVLVPWAFGCPVLGWERRGFDANAIYDLIERERVRSLFLPPTAIHKLRAASGVEPRKLDVVSVHTAGEPLSPAALAWAQETFGKGRVHELYGMTEMGATVGNAPLFDVRPGSMGKPYPGHVVSVRSTQAPDDECADDEVGEIAVRRGDPGMFLGYLHDSVATASRFRGEWLMTGDLAVRDRDGYLWYRGRGDDVFNTSGYRVGPTEIERSLETHRAVAQAAVVGAPDAERGAVVKAFVVLQPDVAPSEGLRSELRDHVRARLATFEVPRIIVFAKALPVTTSGKIRRAELRDPDADRTWSFNPRDASR